MNNTTITTDEFRLLIRAMYQLQTITMAQSDYTLNMGLNRAKETLDELKQIENNYYKL